MEIGKVAIDEDDFSRLWSTLFQEFHKLSTDYKCDAVLIYNTIYIICTAGSNMEEKLYWKIGDFFHNRCKQHRDIIMHTSDFLQAYVEQFAHFSKLVEDIHVLSSFLNNCVKGRQINDFGYLLWDRVIIQTVAKSFFEMVYESDTDIRLQIVQGFLKIKPDVQNPMLYYKQRYEKLALQKLKAKYRLEQIVSIEGLCSAVRTAVEFESNNMSTAVLKCSYDEMYKVLEECFFKERSNEILYNLINYIRYWHGQSLLRCLSKIENDEKNSTGTECSPNFGLVIEGGSDINKPRFFYQQVQENMKESVRADLERGNEKAMLAVQVLLDKEKFRRWTKENDYSDYEDSAKVKKMEKEYNYISIPALEELENSLGTLNLSYRLLKSAYTIYINTILTTHTKILDTTVENVVSLFLSLKIFKGENFNSILLVIIKEYVQRSKPCFLQRLCMFIDAFVKDESQNYSRHESLGDKRPFHSDVISVIETALLLVTDMREFLNTYQLSLSKRLLIKASRLDVELSILQIIKPPQSCHLFKMIQEMQNNSKGLKMLNAIHWNIEPENASLPLPKELLSVIKHINPDFFILDEKSREISFVSAKDVVVDFKLKLKPSKMEQKMVRLAHQFTKIHLSINASVCSFNIYQYVIMKMLQKGPYNVNELVNHLSLAQNVVSSNLAVLLCAGIVSKQGDVYRLDCRGAIEPKDYSEIVMSDEPINDFCVESYLQTVGAKSLKENKKMKRAQLVSDMISLSRIDSTDIAGVEQAIKRLIEKGIAETKGDSIEYVS